MNEQKILLIVLVAAVAVTIGLYVLKAIKQVRYRNDERWNQIQLRAIQIADIINWALVVFLFVLQMTAKTNSSISISRLVTCGLIYFGLRNLLELCGIAFFDRSM